MGENKICTVIWALFAITFIVSLLHSCVRISNIYDQRNGAAEVRTELGNAGEKLAEQAETLGDAIGTTQEAQRTTESILETERGDAELIGECREILRAVRERNGT